MRMIEEGRLLERWQAGPGEEPDEVLVARARLDRRAFAPLYRRYLDPVYRYCYRCLGSREAAEDATAQVFCNALAALPRFKDGSFRAWLFAIAHNAVVDAARRGRSVSVQPLAEGFDRGDGAPTPEEEVLGAERAGTLRALLARLPEDQRRVVELRLAGLKGTEIAQVLGRSRAAVKMLQFRAIARLRHLLLDEKEGLDE